MRGAFLKQGVDPNKDIQFINIPNPSDHLAALQRGEVDMICSVEPFASQIRLAGAGKHFVLPYDQAAGNLTNLIVTRSDVIASQRAGVQGVVTAVVELDNKLIADKAPVDRGHQQAHRPRQEGGDRGAEECLAGSGDPSLADARDRRDDARPQIHREGRLRGSGEEHGLFVPGAGHGKSEE